MRRPVAVLLLSAAGLVPAAAIDCPAGAPSCKVLVLTPQEEDALTRAGGVLDTAERGRFLDLSAIVGYFRKKIDEAPAGEIKKPPDEKPK